MPPQSGQSAKGSKGRPTGTLRQDGAREVDWSRTFHVNNASGFVNGLFGLCSESFEDFLAAGGEAAEVGETLLFQLAQTLDVRFEMRKLGPHEFEVRGAHFATPSGTNICVGLNPESP